MSSPRQSMIIYMFMALCLAAFWFILAFFPVQNLDFGFHLATGKQISDNNSIPRHDPFSHSAAGKKWVTHEWLSQWLMYKIHHRWGYNGLVMVKAGLLTVLILVLACLAYRKNTPVIWAGLALLAGGYAVTFRAFVRPHIATYVFMALLMAYLYRSNRTHRQDYVVLPVLFCLWANFHSGFVFGLLALALCLFPRIIMPGKPAAPRNSALTDALVTFSCAAGASLINPNGISALTYPFRFVADPVVFQFVSELQPVSSPAYRHADFLKGMIVLTGLWLAAAAVRKFRIDITDMALFGVFIVLAVKSNRNVPLWAIVTMAGIFHMTGSGGPARRKGLLSRLPGRMLSASRTVAVLGLIGITAGLSARGVIYGTNMSSEGFRRAGSGLLATKFPDTAIDFLKRYPLDGTMFNVFGYGGYLIWRGYPDVKVFVDGRLFVYIDDVLKDYVRIINGMMSMPSATEKYGFGYCVLSYPEVRGDAMPALYRYLESSPDWRLIYWDDITLIYARNTPGNRDVIHRWEYRAINPLRSTLTDLQKQIQASPAQVKLEADRNLAVCPDSSGGHVNLAELAMHHQDWNQAINHYRAAFKIRPPSRGLQKRILTAYENTGQLAVAERLYEALLAESPRDHELRLYYGMMLIRAERLDDATTQFNIVRTSQPENWFVYHALGITAAERGDWKEAETQWKHALSLNRDAEVVTRNLDRLRQTQK